MGMKKVCDVFGTVKEVKTYRVMVVQTDAKGTATADPKVVETMVDLSPRALERLQGLIRRGVNPPPPRTQPGG